MNENSILLNSGKIWAVIRFNASTGGQGRGSSLDEPIVPANKSFWCYRPAALSHTPREQQPQWRYLMRFLFAQPFCHTATHAARFHFLAGTPSNNLIISFSLAHEFRLLALDLTWVKNRPALNLKRSHRLIKSIAR